MRLKGGGFLRKVALRVMRSMSQGAYSTGCWWGDWFGDKHSAGRTPFLLFSQKANLFPFLSKPAEAGRKPTDRWPWLRAAELARFKRHETSVTSGKGLDFPREGSGTRAGWNVPVGARSRVALVVEQSLPEVRVP